MPEFPDRPSASAFAEEPAADGHTDDEHTDDEHSDDEHTDDEHSDDELDPLDSATVLEAEASYACAYCGESNGIDVDPFAGRVQSYVEDCQVCCRPNVLHLSFDANGGVAVWADVES